MLWKMFLLEMMLCKIFRCVSSTSKRMNHNVGVSISSGDCVRNRGGVSSSGGVSGGDGGSMKYL